VQGVRVKSGQSVRSTIYFPLRTNVDWFVTPDRATLLARRVKQAVLLYDNLVFESGLYKAWIGPSGAVQSWIPPDQLSEEMLQEAVTPQGEKHFLKFGSTVILDQPTERAFGAQFHTLVNEFGGDDLPWITLQALEPADRFKKVGERLARRDIGNKGIVIEGATRVARDVMLKNVNRDMMLASMLGAAVSMDPLHGPLLVQDVAIREMLTPEVGFLALEVVVPDFSMLPWSEVFDLRGHPAFTAFRRKMVEVETRVRECLPDGTVRDLKHEIMGLLLDESLHEVKRLAPRLAPSLACVVADAALDLLVAVPAVRAIKAVGEFAWDFKDWNEHRKSWTVVLHRLRAFR